MFFFKAELIFELDKLRIMRLFEDVDESKKKKKKKNKKKKKCTEENNGLEEISALSVQGDSIQ